MSFYRLREGIGASYQSSPDSPTALKKRANEHKCSSALFFNGGTPKL
ncbi:hypothetical protein OIU83_19580 [Flavobacterium sp. LS1R49]|uniref:Uncharacterized protein n=1 Tax=Flavobacterium shii TaxID=2987687 RepID=A0A9X2ZJL0_9FLAO|nr:hypothetical protein [Flavobacterium shii]MCV9929871.1 hypothetical protein [Flavobacterium shii]